MYDSNDRLRTYVAKMEYICGEVNSGKVKVDGRGGGGGGCGGWGWGWVEGRGVTVNIARHNAYSVYMILDFIILAGYLSMTG